MRTLTYGGAVSLDGFLAGADGAIDWLQAQRNPSAPQTPKGAKSRRSEPAVRTYVFSRTLKAVDGPGLETVSDDAVEFVRNLKRGPGGRICLMGGGELAQSLLGADLVDEIGLNIHPILLGCGVPVLSATLDIE